MTGQTQKCELCSMQSVYTAVDSRNVPHYFCEHHSLRDMPTNEKGYSRLLPLFYVFAFIIALSLMRQFVVGLDLMMWMMDFMGVFFIVFGLFKLYDLKGFASGFSTYDVVAKKWFTFGYMFPFIEITLGILYLAGFMYVFQNVLALTLAGLGMYSVYLVLRNKEEIQCVCLGTLFNLPMTYITLLENGVMFVMAFIMLLM